VKAQASRHHFAALHPAYDVEDFATAWVEMEGGATVLLQASYEHPGTPVGEHRFIRIYGSRAGTEFDPFGAAADRIGLIGRLARRARRVPGRIMGRPAAPATPKDETLRVTYAGADAAERSHLVAWAPRNQTAAVSHFVSRVRDGQVDASAVRRNLAVMRILDAAYRSAVSGRECSTAG
jgi:predicted dehydrogenase